ncbi:NrdH-redoxin [Candidatus Woesearchaeota archaeon CG_4_10_14_0_2_um_filter_57_5]|nr:MAG: NrdH-redoxin [Candidatus Woesearchaeota archaeon CG1_02_57_44]PIN70115.1 MAG: NrdH-redoxin [Candidatus Woesearchaeota archaeon CG11_big_fil_rev_8_21_14_0_20_57_5]PIZ54512.1 MAG: NrdH-redoxin [Candidatus Woesearchaeota archaeon CG_4_10_14_0_2_um_filter_57_5]
MSVKVFSTQSCPWCHRVKDFLREHKVDFEDLDVGRDEKARNEMLEKSGQMGVPVLDINGTIIIGFDQEAITEALGL